MNRRQLLLAVLSAPLLPKASGPLEIVEWVGELPPSPLLTSGYCQTAPFERLEIGTFVMEFDTETSFCTVTECES